MFQLLWNHQNGCALVHWTIKARQSLVSQAIAANYSSNKRGRQPLEWKVRISWRRFRRLYTEWPVLAVSRRSAASEGDLDLNDYFRP
jgi:hypothetical protein